MATEMGDYEAAMAARKAALFAQLPPSATRIAEVGLGAGPNLRYYPKKSVKEIVAIEPNEFMRPYALNAAAAADVALTWLPGVAEALPLPDASVDAVVTTLVLCTGDWMNDWIASRENEQC